MRPRRLRRWLWAAGVLLGLAAAPHAAAQCSCSLPEEECPASCSACALEQACCQCTTPCGLGTCSEGYTPVGSPTFCAPPLDVLQQVTCEMCGPSQTDTCTACQPGFFGSQCANECPGSAADPCSSNGVCDDGLTGSGVCTCDEGFTGEACDEVVGPVPSLPRWGAAALALALLGLIGLGRRGPRRAARLLALALLLAWPVRAAATEPDDPEELLDLSLEELMDVKITSVSRREESLQRAAAAIYVISSDDLRRTGVTSLADALRTVPGVQVSRINSSSWGIGVRGFNAGLSNKLLVLIDGRSVYSPLFSGVFWDMQDVLLEDVLRIEVIRGPGGTLWGANAVNGVINVITKSAADTQGGLLSVGAGTEELGFGGARVGFRTGEAGHLRFFSRYFDRGPGGERGGFDDDWRRGQLGFRGDWKPGAQDELTLQGDIYRGQVRQRVGIPSLTPPAIRRVDTDGGRGGANLLARWTRKLGDRSEASLRVYYDQTAFDHITVEERRSTYDFDFQHRFEFLERHDIVWGLGYRHSRDEIDSTLALALLPAERRIRVRSGFVQDEISFLDDRLRLVLGTKIERNDFTGWEIQPTARLSFAPSPEHSLWLAVSRAVRTPTRLEEDLLAAGSPLAAPCGGDPALPCVFASSGSRSLTSEILVALEGGFRWQATSSLAFDLSLFLNDYEDLIGAESTLRTQAGTQPTPHNVFVVAEFQNRVEAHAWGGEIVGWWSPRDWWRIQAHYGLFRTSFHADSGSAATRALKLQEMQTPRHQAFLRSSFDLPRDFEFDTMLRYVGHARGLGARSYLELDLRLGWRPRENFEISLVGRNLIEGEHLENAGANATQVQRGVYGQVRWWFD